jgi:hypothetical protein
VFVKLAIIALALAVLPACGHGSAVATTVPVAAASQGAGTYSDPAGWTVDVPPGWHVLPFETTDGGATSKGALLSNVELPPPSVKPGYPIQTNSKDLPDDGIALIIGIDDDPSDAQQPPKSPPQPPLTLDMFAEGSALAGSPTLDLLWFSGNGHTFLATVKSGPTAGTADRAKLQEAVASLRFES